VEAEYRIDLTREIHLGPKPFAYSMAKVAEYSTLSKAFSKSILRIIIGFFERWQICRYSNALAMQSWIFLDLIKPYWFWCKIGIISF
jgi:hypothetical protein